MVTSLPPLLNDLPMVLVHDIYKASTVDAKRRMAPHIPPYMTKVSHSLLKKFQELSSIHTNRPVQLKKKRGNEWYDITGYEVAVGSFVYHVKDVANSIVLNKAYQDSVPVEERKEITDPTIRVQRRCSKRINYTTRCTTFKRMVSGDAWHVPFWERQLYA